MLEARDRVGGRTEGGRTADGTPIELGGQWLGPTQNRMYELVDELGLETFPTYNTGQHVVHLGGRQLPARCRAGVPCRSSARSCWPTCSGACDASTPSPNAVPLDQPWTAADARELDGQTFETWIRQNLRTELGRAYFRIATEAVFSTESTDLSALHAAFYAHSGADLETLLSVDRGAQQDRVVGGTIRISEEMADAAGRPCAAGVPGAAHRARRRRGRVSSCAAARCVEGDSVIVTLPPTLAGRLEYAPALPVVAGPAHPATAGRIGHQVARASTTSRSGATTA